MELVLSPGRLGGGDKNGSPFHNEEVREWSHVDRLTGMLEHARIETGRWQTRHLGSAQAYGKVIDSRERNSADGNVVQKARRQVEVFQSQGIGGRSVQVVRASQWSSSRITGSNSTSPVSVSTNETQFRNGNTDDLVLQASGKSVSGRPMQIQNSGGDESLAKLSQVSRLCRQINAEAINKRANIHSAATSNKPQMIHASPLLNSRFKRLDISNENVKQTSGFLQNTNSTFKTTSNEDLTNSIDNIKTHTKFSRDCKARRSLQIQKSIDSSSAPEKSTEKQEIIPLGFGRIENSSVSNGDLGFGESRSPRTNSTSSSDSDQETCVVKNERKAMKSYVLGMSDTDNDLITSSNLAVSEDKFPTEQSADLENGVGISKSEYLRPTAILLKPKTIQPVPTVIGKPNKTVVHLNNKLTIEKKTDQLLSNSLEKSLVTGNLIRPIAGMQSRVQSLADRFSNRNNNFISNANESMQMDAQSSFLIGRKQSFDSASRIESLISRSTAMIEGPSNTADETEPVLQVQQTRDKKLLSDDQSSSVVRPVKKVGFSKTEVHFAAESGKVNIVETDCKPPPSNRFRRRRRNSLVATNGTMPINKNLPLIHFGDTSYEKYIFGQGNNGGSIKSDFIPKDNKLPGEVEEPDLSAHFQIAEIKNDNDQKLVAPAEDIIKGGWGARIKTILQSDPELSIDDNGLGLNTADKKYDALDETIVDHSFKGHTTTVNLGANSISKQLQKHRNGGKCNTISTGIQLQFSTKIEKLRPIITSNNIVTIAAAKKSLTKIIPVEKTNTPSPSIVSKIPRPLIQAQQSVLKSAHLVMNLNRINNFKTFVANSSENESSSTNSDNNSSNFKNQLSSFHNNCTEMVTCHRHSHRVDVANNNHERNTPTITVNSNNKINYPTRFIPLRIKHFNERETTPREIEKKVDEVVCNEDTRENQQLQYSSGSEQADEEVRSYMLGTKTDRKEIMQTQKFANSVTMEEKWSVQNSEEHFGARRTIRETRISNDDCIDKPVDQNHIIGLSIDDNDDDELDIVNSGLPAVEEMCFEPNKTVEKSLVTDKLVANESNIVTTDNENNKVLLNIVKTHEPIIARVEDRLRSPEVGRKLFAIKKLRSHNSMQQPERNEKARREITAHQTSVNKSYLMSSTKTRIKPKAKDHCDDKNTKEVTNGSNDDSKTTDPTYVNIFENEKQNVPIYENYNVERKKNLMDDKYLKTNNHNGDIKVSAEFKTLTDATIQTSNSHYDTETTLSNTDCEGKNLKQYSNTSRSSDIAQLTTITENNSIKRTNIDGQKIKLSKTRSKKIPRPPSSTSSIESIHRSSGYETAKESQARSLHNRSTRSSRLHRVCNNRETSGNESSERYSSANEKKKNSSEQITNTRTSRSNHSADSSTATRNLNGSTRSKKPIEIVYQTAVYNMKNEKLSKSRSKESKTPRYINDLICGSKPAKRSTDVRHVKGPAPSQQRGNHKSASPTHRHWK
ncbi:uncharacterized protein LOC105687726 isoform X1 [Athalia rosae]|uniref:uncharacterized protein LOC105687726 isoform X1 n=1 Tax=Athalia rosae TaxID=37344 RepID=UPI0020339B8F|nr:uncharacterized protein LOC105687726 isoform X1 [Athalia rosae]